VSRNDLSELIGAFREEFDSVVPNLQSSYAEIVQANGSTDEVAAPLEEYAGHIGRIRDTAQLLGLLGMVATCDIVNESLTIAAGSPETNWAELRDFFDGWPALTLAYLKGTTDIANCAQLAGHFAKAPAAIDSAGKGNLVELLLAIPTLDSALTADEGPTRPTVAEDADVSIEIPSDVDQSVFDGLMQDAPGHAAELTELISKIAAGSATTAELVHAKRIAHTFKGSAHIVGIKGLAHIAHHTEDILEYFEREQVKVPPAICQVLIDVAFCLEQMTSALLGEDDPPANAREVLQSVLDWANRIDRGELDEMEPDANERVEETPASGDLLDFSPDPTRQIAREEVRVEVREAVPEEVREEAPLPALALEVDASPAQNAAPDFELSALLGDATPSAETVAKESAEFDLDQLLDGTVAAATAPLPANTAPLAKKTPTLPTQPLTRTMPLGNKPAVRSEPTGPLPTGQSDAGASNLVTQQALRVSVKTVDELFRLTSELSIKVGQLQAVLKSTTHHSRQLLTQNLAVQKRVFELENLVDVRGLAAMRSRGDNARVGGFDPLEMDQYNELHSVTRSLAEETSDVRTLSAALEEDIAKLTSVYLQHDRIRKDLQYITTSTRMAPIKSLLPRLSRNVKQTCQATGKKAELELEGGDTLFDGEVLSKLADPLLHLLRNAVDHGVETAEERALIGKPDVARIRLSFTRHGQSVVVRCTDDGRGLDLARIRAKAIERGLIQTDRVLEERDLARLILLPGFSTKDRVSEISGRGVGLDVVNDRVKSLKGTIEIRSEGSGKGTTFEMRIPASLVSVHALLVQASGQQYALPTHTIEQAFAPEAGEYADIAGEMHFKYRERLYPMRKLSDMGGIGRAGDKQLELNDYSVVLVRGDEKTVAILVESIVDGRDLITKDMGKFVRRVRGVAGVAILGDGVVAPLLDIPEMLRAPVAAQGHAHEGTLAAPIEQIRVLVVDDSLGVRRSLMQLIGDSGLDCQSANDGVEAVQVIEKFRPHVVITDLEMPNMNGLELTAHLRKRADTRDLPIIMITSRSQAKHRELAEKSGVTVYLTKPYGDTELMAHIGNLIEGRPSDLKTAA
jgi:chemotaxis protein histidine kinase CheA/ActR/RegA family two-component response regulator